MSVAATSKQLKIRELWGYATGEGATSITINWSWLPTTVIASCDQVLWSGTLLIPISPLCIQLLIQQVHKPSDWSPNPSSFR